MNLEEGLEIFEIYLDYKYFHLIIVEYKNRI